MEVIVDGMTHSIGKLQESIDSLSNLKEQGTDYMMPVLEDYAYQLHELAKGVGQVIQMHNGGRNG
jgi:hypothetical protein